MASGLLDLVSDFFNHYSLRIRSTHIQYVSMICLEIHLCLDLGIHVEGNVLEARNTRPNLSELIVQLPARWSNQGIQKMSTTWHVHVNTCRFLQAAASLKSK
jgi:hypothetical protein